MARGASCSARGAHKIEVGSSVAWMIGGLQLTYMLDRGVRRKTRTIEFPVAATAFSLPRVDAAFIAGAHGMVYRYRFVPLDYTRPAHDYRSGVQCGHGDR